MRNVSLVVVSVALLSAPVHAAGLLSKLFWKGEIERAMIPRAGVRMLELELVQRPARIAAGGLTKLQFRVKQLTNPDPQFIGPPVRLRRYSPSGTQLEARWIQPNGAGLYEAEVPVEAGQQYLYFESGDERTMLAKVPWVVLKAAD
jgi:hypothetical protein